MREFEKLREYDYEYAAAGRGDRDGKAAIRANVERQQILQLGRLARLTQLEETRGLCRRALRADVERQLRESRALRAAADLRLEAPLTPMGQLLAAAPRARW